MSWFEDVWSVAFWSLPLEVVIDGRWPGSNHVEPSKNGRFHGPFCWTICCQALQCAFGDALKIQSTGPTETTTFDGQLLPKTPKPKTGPKSGTIPLSVLQDCRVKSLVPSLLGKLDCWSTVCNWDGLSTWLFSWDLQAQQNWGLDPETIWREVCLNSSRCGWWKSKLGQKQVQNHWGGFGISWGSRQYTTGGWFQTCFKYLGFFHWVHWWSSHCLGGGWAMLSYADAQCQVSPGLPSMWISQILYWSSLAEGHDLVSTKASVLCRSMPKYGISPGHIDWFFQHLAEYILDCQS